MLTANWGGCAHQIKSALGLQLVGAVGVTRVSGQHCLLLGSPEILWYLSIGANQSENRNASGGNNPQRSDRVMSMATLTQESLIHLLR